MQGKPVANVIVSFSPRPIEQGATAPTRPSLGEVDEQGRFSLSTLTPGDGAAVGRHRVMVLSSNRNAAPPGKLPANYEVEVKQGENHFVLDLSNRK